MCIYTEFMCFYTRVQLITISKFGYKLRFVMRDTTLIRDRPQFMQSVLTVKSKNYLTPHYIRVILEGDMNVYEQANVGDNNKLIFPESGVTNLPKFGEERSGVVPPPMRTYTLRAIDREQDTMTIDFVVHGDEGPASKWAINAEKGDQLGVLMKARTKPLFKPADNYFLFGDHTALPVISVILEELPKNSVGTVVLEVYSAEDRLMLAKPEKVDLIWLFNDHPGRGSQLARTLRNYNWVDVANTYVFGAGEQSIIKEIGHFLRTETCLKRDQWQVMSYWKYGESEESSSDERRKSSRQD